MRSKRRAKIISVEQGFSATGCLTLRPAASRQLIPPPANGLLRFGDGMESAPALVRTLLLTYAAMLSPALLLVTVVTLAIGFERLRGRRRSAPSTSPAPAIESAEGVRIRRRMTRARQPAVLLTNAAGAQFTKLGGEPELPADFGWPSRPEGALRFLCQLELSDVRAAGGPPWLPEQGCIYVFHDERYGCADQAKVIYLPERAHTRALAPTAASAWPYAERRLGFRSVASYPSLDWLGEEQSAVSEAELAGLVMDEQLSGGQLDHRIGGFPGEIQGGRLAVSCELLARGRDAYADRDVTPAIERAARSWRLLLQVDSDEELGISWGDGGRLYIFVREQDAVAGDFSKTVTLSQWH